MPEPIERHSEPVWRRQAVAEAAAGAGRLGCSAGETPSSVGVAGTVGSACRRSTSGAEARGGPASGAGTIASMLIHPQIDPVALRLGPLSVHWYGLTYLAAFLMFVWLGRRRLRHPAYADLSGQQAWSARDVEDILFLGVLGVVLGVEDLRVGGLLQHDYRGVGAGAKLLTAVAPLARALAEQAPQIQAAIEAQVKPFE